MRPAGPPCFDVARRGQRIANVGAEGELDNPLPGCVEIRSRGQEHAVVRDDPQQDFLVPADAPGLVPGRGGERTG